MASPMNPSILLLLTALLATAPARASANDQPANSMVDAGTVESVLTMQLDGSIVIEKDGSVGSYSFDAPPSAGLAPLLDKTIQGWLFEPVLVDGALVRAESRMRISLAATQTGEDSYSVRIDNVVFPWKQGAKRADGDSPPPRVGFLSPKMPPPIYPKALERAGITGRVLLALCFNPDGSVKDAVAVQSMLFDVRGRERLLAAAIKEMEDSALSAARHWTVQLQVPEGMAPTPSRLTATTTVNYVMDNRRDKSPVPGEWSRVSRTPKREMPWVRHEEKGRQDVGVADVKNGEMMPLISPLHLKTPLGAAL
jgi:hypothetical protein